MKKNYILTGLLSLSMSITFGQFQQIEEGGFENWENLTLASEEPLQWSSLKTADALAAQAPKVLSPDAGRGAGKCIKLEVKNAFGIAANGIITNGMVHADFNPALGYVYTNASDAQWNTPFSSFPDSVVGYYKYAPINGDRGKVEIILHSGSNAKLPENGTAGAQIARARYDVTTATGSWTRFSAPFGYYNNNTPNYMLIVITSGDSTISEIGTIAWYDDIELIYNTITTGTIAQLTYSVTNTVGAPITIPYTLSSDAPSSIQLIAQLSDENGSFSHPVNLDTITGTTSGNIVTEIPPQTQPGTAYRVRVISTSPMFKTRNIVAGTDDLTVNLVGNYITPDNQDFPSGVVGQGATVFTVYETTPATSREWFIGDSSGVNFQAFAPAETGTTLSYDPATKGYATLVCVSETATDSLISNKVLVYYGQLGLMEYNANAINAKVYQSNNKILIQSDEKIDYAVFNASGKLISKGEVNKQIATFTPQKTGLYFVQLRNEKALDTKKIIFNK